MFFPLIRCVSKIKAYRNIDVTLCQRNNHDAAYQLAGYRTQVRAGIEVFLCLAWFTPPVKTTSKPALLA
jgi:hypothetical protein